MFRAPKNQLLLAAIVVAAIVIAIPVSIFGVIGVLWRFFTSPGRDHTGLLFRKELGVRRRQWGPVSPVSRLELARAKKIRMYSSVTT
jgi:hypothetical protein